jgi:hypothetical protein
MLSDLVGIIDMLKEISFEGMLGNPLACMPPSHADVLPGPYRGLMTAPKFIGSYCYYRYSPFLILLLLKTLQSFPLAPKMMMIRSREHVYPARGSSSCSSNLNVFRDAVAETTTTQNKDLFFAQETTTATGTGSRHSAARTTMMTNTGWTQAGPDPATKPDYDNIHGPLGKWLDTLFLTIFRNKLAEQVYGDLAEEFRANNDSNSSSSSSSRSRTPFAAASWDARQAPANFTQIVQLAAALHARFRDPLVVQRRAQTVLQHLFPSWLPGQYALLFSRPFPAFAARMNARATATAGVWLMGECHVNDVPLSFDQRGEPRTMGKDQGVLVTRCRFLEESGCASVCVHSCKIPTQNFFAQRMGLPLTMEPDYATGSCQFSFGRWQDPVTTEAAALSTPCLTRCPTAVAVPAKPRGVHLRRLDAPQQPTTATKRSRTIEMSNDGRRRRR